MLYSYKKATAQNPHPGKKIPPFLKVFPLIISSLGMALLGSVLFPVISAFVSSISFRPQWASTLLSPAVYESNASLVSEPVVIGQGADFTRASSWFQGDLVSFEPLQTTTSGEKDSDLPLSYSISIPTLGLSDLNVNLFDEDLTRSLVQYPQTALPGQDGSPVIFGHSTLPQFFDPKKYTTIFSNLPKIKTGADIFVRYKDREYSYRVTKIFEVKPTDLWVLKQDYNQKTIKLITCTPPGTTLKRLVVEGVLINTP